MISLLVISIQTLVWPERLGDGDIAVIRSRCYFKIGCTEHDKTWKQTDIYFTKIRTRLNWFQIWMVSVSFYSEPFCFGGLSKIIIMLPRIRTNILYRTHQKSRIVKSNILFLTNINTSQLFVNLIIYFLNVLVSV